MTFKFTDDQQNAIDTFIDFLADTDNKFMVIQGSSGTGKSTLIKHLHHVVEKHQEMYALLLKKDTRESDFEIVLTATTNPAAAVLKNLTGLPAYTIHSLIGAIPRDNYKTGKTDIFLRRGTKHTLFNKLVIIDEGSMINDKLLYYIDSQLIDCKVVIIGDWFQLASVGQVTTTMENITGPIAKLNKILRNSGIIQQVGAQFRDTVRTGVFKSIPTGHAALEHVDGPTFQKMINTAFLDPDYSIKKAKILAWTNGKVLEYSDYIRELLGKPKDIQKGETVYTNKAIVSKKITITADSPVTIQDVGASFEHETYGIPVKLVTLNNGHSAYLPNNPMQAKQLVNKLQREKSWTDYFHIKNDWLDLRLPYASTVHKAQGSEYETVFIDLADIGRCSIPTDVARMLYVAITRATTKVVLYGKLPAKYAG